MGVRGFWGGLSIVRHRSRFPIFCNEQVFFMRKKRDLSFDPFEFFGPRFSLNLNFRVLTKFYRALDIFWTRSSIPFWFEFIHAFSLKETWVHLKETWFPLKETSVHLKETCFYLKETWVHLNVSGGSLPGPEPMVGASALVFLWKASIFGTSNFANGSNPFFSLFWTSRFFAHKKQDRCRTLK